MKKLISASLLIIAILSVSSCAKKGCTDPTASNYNSSATKDDGSCNDATIGLVGTYVGAIRDSSNALDTSATQTIIISKIDDATIKIQPASGGATTATFSAKPILSGSDYQISVPSQGGGTISANPSCSGCFGTTCGAYQASSRTFVYSIIFQTNTVSGIESFTGVKQ